jgi:hypothetical protein
MTREKGFLDLFFSLPHSFFFTHCNFVIRSFTNFKVIEVIQNFMISKLCLIVLCFKMICVYIICFQLCFLSYITLYVLDVILEIRTSVIFWGILPQSNYDSIQMTLKNQALHSTASLQIVIKLYISLISV